MVELFLEVVRYGFLGLGLMALLVTSAGTLELTLINLGAFLPRRSRKKESDGSRKIRVAVVVPAHNEEDQVGKTVASIMRCQTAGCETSVIVVADNCSDRTAAVAEAAGARVMIRKDPDRRGKGFALDFAFGPLLKEGFDIFVVVDADSEVPPNFLQAIVEEFAAGSKADKHGTYSIQDQMRNGRG